MYPHKHNIVDYQEVRRRGPTAAAAAEEEKKGAESAAAAARVAGRAAMDPR